MQPNGEVAYTRYKYRAKKSPNGVEIKTPLQLAATLALPSVYCDYSTHLILGYF